MIDLELIKQLDKSNMFEVLKNTFKQISTATDIVKNTDLSVFESKFTRIIIAGMGGSAIGGDLARSLFLNTDDAKHLEITVFRDYEPIRHIDENTLFIASSYSGGTEETKAALNFAYECTSNIVTVSSGGYLEKFAKANSFPHVKMPEGYQPRCAIGLSFTAVTQLILALSDIPDTVVEQIQSNLKFASYILEEAGILYSQVNEENNAIRLAEQIKGKIPLIYSSGILASVNLRWRGQFQENAKCPAFGNILPEMNHNEINGWEYPESIKNIFQPIFLTDLLDHPRVALRIEATRDVFKQNGLNSLIFTGRGKSYTERMFSLISLADWTSYYLGILYGADPTDIRMISLLKEIMTAKSDF